MSYQLEQIAEEKYIRFYYPVTGVFSKIKGNCQIYVNSLLAQKKIADPDPFLLTDDNLQFWYGSGKAGMEQAFNLQAQLSRGIMTLTDVTQFDAANNLITLRVGYKSTLNAATLPAWESAIEQYIIAYVLRDWYALFGFDNDAGFPVRQKALFDIAWSRSLSDLSWLRIGTVEAARISLEEGMREYIDENFVLIN